MNLSSYKKHKAEAELRECLIKGCKSKDEKIRCSDNFGSFYLCVYDYLRLQRFFQLSNPRLQEKPLYNMSRIKKNTRFSLADWHKIGDLQDDLLYWAGYFQKNYRWDEKRADEGIDKIIEIAFELQEIKERLAKEVG